MRFVASRKTNISDDARVNSRTTKNYLRNKLISCEVKLLTYFFDLLSVYFTEHYHGGETLCGKWAQSSVLCHPTCDLVFSSLTN
jgi:hypothetical protein